jgi:hypothetical protein
MALHRRQLLTGLGAAVAVAGLSRAELACQPYDSDWTVCQAGLRFSPEVRTAQQECEYWCWAACIEAIFAIRGYTVSQAAIVERVYADPVCAPAEGQTIASAASGAWRDAKGKTFSAGAEVLIDGNTGLWRADSAAVADAELTAGRPLIVGTAGHAVLLTAVTYAHDTQGNYQILEMVVRDPWPTSPNRRTLSQMEAQQMYFLAAVHTA